MPPKVTRYQSQVPSARMENLPGPARQDAPIDVGNTAMARNMKMLATVGQQAGDAYLKRERELQEAQVAADVLSEATQLQDAARQFEVQYRETNRGDDARQAAQATDQFFTDQMQARSQRFIGDPRTLLLWQRQAFGVRQGALTRAQAYADQQDQVYREDTTRARIALFYQNVATADDTQAASMRQDLAAELAALNPGRDMRATLAEVDMNTAVGRINAAAAREDFETANKLLQANQGILGQNYDEMVARVENARRTSMQNQGIDMALNLFHQNADASTAWERISRIGDRDMRAAAQSQYSTLLTMQLKIDEQTYQTSAIDVRARIDSMAETNLAEAEAYVVGLPQNTDLERRVHDFARSRLNEWKRSGGVDPLTQSSNYLELRARILGGHITEREQIRADPLAPGVTQGDLDDLEGMLDTSQQTTEKAINDAFSAAFGARRWGNLQRSNPDLVFDYMQQVRTRVRETNRAQDTDYIQQVADTLALQGSVRSDYGAINWAREVVGGNALADALRGGEFNLEQLGASVGSGDPLWLPDSTTPEFRADWNSWEPAQRQEWLDLYSQDEGKAMRAAYLGQRLTEIGPRQ